MTSGGDEHAVPASITDSGKPERFVLSARQWSLLEPCLRPPLRDLHNLAAMLRSRTAMPIMPLSIQDETGNFDCGVAILNEGLRRDIAAAKTMAGSAFALRHEGHIAGYYRLRPSSFVRAEDGAAIAIQFLPRLAVNRRDQSAGMGRASWRMPSAARRAPATGPVPFMSMPCRSRSCTSTGVSDSGRHRHQSILSGFFCRSRTSCRQRKFSGKTPETGGSSPPETPPRPQNFLSLAEPFP